MAYICNVANGTDIFWKRDAWIRPLSRYSTYGTYVLCTTLRQLLLLLQPQPPDLVWGKKQQQQQYEQCCSNSARSGMIAGAKCDYMSCLIRTSLITSYVCLYTSIYIYILIIYIGIKHSKYVPGITDRRGTKLCETRSRSRSSSVWSLGLRFQYRDAARDMQPL